MNLRNHNNDDKDSRTSYNEFKESFYSGKNPNASNGYNYIALAKNPKLEQNPFHLNTNTGVGAYVDPVYMDERKRQFKLKERHIKDFNYYWEMFCRGNLGATSHIDCAKCGYVLCKQQDMLPHEMAWKKKGTKIENGMGLCDGVFMRKPEWMKFYVINNGFKACCPMCKIRIGNVK